MAWEDELASELAKLHLRAGAAAPNVVDKMGEHLRYMTFGDSELDPSVARKRLCMLLQRGVQELETPAVRRLLLEALNVVEGEPQLDQRVASIRRWMHCSTRTVQRRLVDAERQLAQSLVRQWRELSDDNRFAERGWLVVAMESHAYLSQPHTQFEGFRVIRATQGGLGEIRDSFTIPQPDPTNPCPDVVIEPIVGCEQVTVERVSASTWTYHVQLPSRLAAGEEHRLGLRIVLPGAQYVRPYNALVALRSTRRFTAWLHLSEQDRVAAAWRYDGVPAAIMEDQTQLGPSLDVGVNGPVVADWPLIRSGLAYGIGWRLKD